LTDRQPARSGAVWTAAGAPDATELAYVGLGLQLGTPVGQDAH
jgi:hypothetical protein